MRISFLTLYILFIVALLAASLFVPHSEASLVGPGVAEGGKTIVDVLDGLTKLIVSLNTAMLGAAATLTVKGQDWSTQWDRFDSILIVLTFGCGAASYFGGYLCYARELSTLAVTAAPSVNPIEPDMIWAIRIEYWGVVAGVCLLGAVFTRMLEKKTLAKSSKVRA